ncbi:uncharacterized protein CIMG_10860 [Coccidioides immitis RS]|uniref:Uncharacterized protein n=1 Tax=Coccidioides immitis (strain RS) TaxID=246410 RepID=A0A0D8JS04_COCIM|nr:uncharacterized protein CIMG_10860 [Coccidioides immitis RS]KJF60077.1 hypothetical protein CIMG_10860 [Coccidioides immitis RS]
MTSQVTFSLGRLHQMMPTRDNRIYILQILDLRIHWPMMMCEKYKKVFCLEETGSARCLRTLEHKF